MFSSPGTPRRPQTATERLASVRGNLHALREKVEVAESYSLAHLAANGVYVAPPTNDHKGREKTLESSMSVQQLPSAATIQCFEDSMILLKQHAIKIEEHLAAEALTRAEADKKLKLSVDQTIRDLAASMERSALESISELHVQMDTLKKKVDKLQTELAVEREKNVRLTQELKFQATQGMSEVKDHVTQLRQTFQSSQSLLAKNLTENVFRLQERLEAERHSREEMQRAVREEISIAAKQRDKHDDRLLQKLRDDIVALESQLQNEHDSREKAEEQLAAAMEEVVGQVQLGLHNLSRV